MATKIVTINTWKNLPAEKLAAAFGAKYTGRVYWRVLGNGFYNLEFHGWPWAGCEDTEPEQWVKKAGLWVSDTVDGWKAPADAEQAKAEMDRLYGTFQANTVRVRPVMSLNVFKLSH